ncbi:transcriptional regulator [Sedimentibacter sp. zth1]|uniref:DRTGG domain-containing protein n=1 Tax=Sedimentibacter sp. zth1 TaxID=2816908 RepID=UPI001A92D69E|nr:DRTGG domain-containing protein [Sedimentibacter sp. zth1]QSX06197.1 transcriptional regulator [Sedimentibacter sp. zth1]
MKVTEFIKVLNAECVTRLITDDKNYNFAFASDLMSDVLALADSSTVLITGLNNPQVIRTAEMMDISLIILVRGKIPSKETIELATEANITILTTHSIMFETCGILYKSGLRPI